MNDKGGTGLIALILALVLVPFFLLLVLVMGIADEEDRENGTSCLGPGSGLGSGDRLAPRGSFLKPVDPSIVTVTSGFGQRWGTQHQGIDLAGAVGTPIYASADGVVRHAGPASGFGQWVVLDHVQGGQLTSTVYGHIETYTVAVGEQVRAGQQIATLGNRGQSTGPHLHWELWPGGWGTAAVDPLPFYDAAPAPGQSSAGPTTPVPPAPSQGDLAQPLPPSVGSEQGLQVDAKKLARAMHLKFGDRIAGLGGWRPGGGYATDHTEGRAVDLMIPNHRSGDGVALGDEITDYILANAAFFDVEYVIWRQTYYPVGGAPSLMEDRGSETQNHYDHVHISVRGQGTDERLVSWGTLPGGSGNATAAAADCLVSGEGLGDRLADGTVPPEFAPWIERAGSICPQITPSLLAAQLAAENGFRHGAGAPVSQAGARGPAQFMPGTWARYGQDYDGDGKVDVNSIGDAVLAQGHYMCTLAATIDGAIAEGTVSAPNGRTELYLAGYNAGEGAVLASGGFPTGHTDYVVQTRPYADKILAAEPAVPGDEQPVKRGKPVRITRITVAAVCTAAAVAGCGSDTTADQHAREGSDDHQVIEPLSPRQIDADQTATTAMGMVLSWQPAIDESKADALIRATAYLGGDLLAVAESGTRAEVRPDADWQQWAAAKDAVSATCVRAESTPVAPAGMRTLVVDVTCTQTVLHAGGRSTRLTPQLWRTIVTRTDAGWRLTDYRFQQ